MKKGLKTGTGGEFNAKAQRRGDAKKRTDWKAKCRRARRELFKANKDLEESEKAGMEVFREHEELKRRVREMPAKIVAGEAEIAELKKRHQEAVEIGLKACEEVKALRLLLKEALQDLDWHKRCEKNLEETMDEELKGKKLRISELENALEIKQLEREGMTATARGLHEALGAMLNGV